MVLSFSCAGRVPLSRCGAASFPARLRNVKLCKAQATPHSSGKGDGDVRTIRKRQRSRRRSSGLGGSGVSGTGRLPRDRGPLRIVLGSLAMAHWLVAAAASTGRPGHRHDRLGARDHVQGINQSAPPMPTRTRTRFGISPYKPLKLRGRFCTVWDGQVPDFSVSSKSCRGHQSFRQHVDLSGVLARFRKPSRNRNATGPPVIVQKRETPLPRHCPFAHHDERRPVSRVRPVGLLTSSISASMERRRVSARLMSCRVR